MNNLRLFLSLILACLTQANASARISPRNCIIPGNLIRMSPDTSPFLRSSGELLLAGLAPFLLDRYITREDYARISWQTVGYNLNPRHWEWDYDGFQTNQIGHPFHGSLFFNAFRSNGYSFWQSVPAAFAGSYLWETFSENQPPAPNDFVNTGFGGIILGETAHRLSARLLRNGSRGLKKQAAELLALFIDPMNGFNRILNGQWGRPTLSSPADKTPLKLEFDAGLRHYDGVSSKLLRNGRFGVYGRIRLFYGDPALDPKTPFSNISMIVEGGQDDSSMINVVTVYGSLTGWILHSGTNSHVAALSANYDYIHNVAFLYSGQSLRMTLFSHFSLGGKNSLATSLGAGPVILAAVPNSYLFHTRNYDYGPGFSFNGAATLLLANRLTGTINYRGGWMRTVNGNATAYFLHVITADVSIRVAPRFGLGGEIGYFTLHGTYPHFAAIDRTYPYLRISVRYTL
ncbi:DUF3943 domain-containing protein [Puia sp. P3]|uniref:DUF3943 domain-containing protein n=1 Tax=Puia sp. P3 TaxID=3423952 RepID=UPI003D67C9B5